MRRINKTIPPVAVILIAALLMVHPRVVAQQDDQATFRTGTRLLFFIAASSTARAAW
jgi:hypothetical protein